ncbi:TraR/DksA family transcriptional regulator [Vibrio agarivorans]|uniref:TraR/DksA family transcriptional regulator n=1 Tax=Vibrio agarivorans TaxID=153622 RepID=A0ABT7Y739_9VIBR|nr:TraR/DksA family transcriptional regulator [Vibrio agarivorans]MDN2483861.1 TraR/DksA family transcriptional regulator [Vibrio agarivorans]
MNPKPLLTIQELQDRMPGALNKVSIDLEAKRTELREHRGNHFGASDIVDKSAIQTDEEEIIGNINRLIKVKNSIEVAMGAIALQEYGYCKSCGVKISLGRLNANPVALQCLDCQSYGEPSHLRRQTQSVCA